MTSSTISEITNSYWGPEILCFHVNASAGSSAVVTGPDLNLVTLSRTGTGDYTLTFAETLLQVPYVFQPMLEHADGQCQVSAVTTTTIRIKVRTVASSPAAADYDFSVIVLANRDLTHYRAAGSGL